MFSIVEYLDLRDSKIAQKNIHSNIKKIKQRPTVGMMNERFLLAYDNWISYCNGEKDVEELCRYC